MCVCVSVCQADVLAPTRQKLTTAVSVTQVTCSPAMVSGGTELQLITEVFHRLYHISEKNVDFYSAIRFFYNYVYFQNIKQA